MHTDQVKHNPEICPSCQKKAHLKAEDGRYEAWKEKFRDLGGYENGTVGSSIAVVNSFINDFTPEQAVRRQKREDAEAEKKFKQTLITIGVCVVVGLLAWLLQPLFI